MRYIKKNLTINNSNIYQDIFEKRNVKQIVHYTYPRTTPISIDDAASLDFQTHIWKLGDRLHKLSSIFYDDPKYWWVIAQFNAKPTDSHYTLGDVVRIPLPLQEALDLIDG